MLPLPNPPVPEFAKPSNAAALLRCTLSVAFDDDPAAGAQPEKGPRAILGLVAHELLEATNRGELAAARIREEWDRRIRENCERGREADRWGAPEAWANYQRLRLRTIRRCKKIAESRAAMGCVTRDEAKDPDGRAGERNRAGGGSEVTLVASDGRLRGRLDRVDVGPPRIIEDYKAGAICDENGQIKEDYRVQLLLYAVLDHDQSGTWADAVKLSSLLNDESVEFEVDPNEARAVLKDTMLALERYQSAVASDDLLLLAAPSPSSCSKCAHRMHCPAFWGAADVSWAESGVFAAWGNMLEAVRANGRLGLKLNSVKGTARGLITISGIDEARVDSDALNDGAAVAIDNFYSRTGSADLFHANARTRVARAVPQT